MNKLTPKEINWRIARTKAHLAQIGNSQTFRKEIELTEQLAAKLSITRSEAERMLKTFITIIYETLKDDGFAGAPPFGAPFGRLKPQESPLKPGTPGTRGLHLVLCERVNISR